MNQRYAFNYLDDPKGTLGDLTQQSELSTIVNEDLRNKDPVAYTLLRMLSLDEDQINDLEDTIG